MYTIITIVIIAKQCQVQINKKLKKIYKVTKINSFAMIDLSYETA